MTCARDTIRTGPSSPIAAAGAHSRAMSSYPKEISSSQKSLEGYSEIHIGIALSSHGNFSMDWAVLFYIHIYRLKINKDCTLIIGWWNTLVPTGRLYSETGMLLGCTMILMHWLMLAANRYDSSARSHLSFREHLLQKPQVSVKRQLV